MNEIMGINVTSPRRWLAFNGLLHHTMHRVRQKALDLTQIYSLPLTGFLFMKQSGEERCSPVKTRNRITKRNVQHGRRLMFTALQMWQP